MPEAKRIEGFLFQNSAGVIMGRVTNNRGADVTQASLTSLVLTVEDKADPGVAVASSPYTLTVADVIFDTLQTDTIWTNTTDGFNFLYDTENAQLVKGATSYIFQFRATPTSGESAVWVYEPITEATVTDHTT